MSRPNPTPVDPELLAELRAIPVEGQGTLLDEMVALFTEDNVKRIEALNAALAAGAAAEIAEVAHGLKGSCSNFGAYALVERCQAIERAARAGNLAGVRVELDAAVGEMARVVEALWAALATRADE